MISWISTTWASVVAFQSSAPFATTVDLAILIVAMLPVLYLYPKFLFGDAARARVLARSPTLVGWLFFFCAFEVLLHAIKIQLVWKIVILLAALVLFPLLFVLEEIIS